LAQRLQPRILPGVALAMIRVDRPLLALVGFSVMRSPAMIWASLGCRRNPMFRSTDPPPTSAAFAATVPRPAAARRQTSLSEAIVALSGSQAGRVGELISGSGVIPMALVYCLSGSNACGLCVRESLCVGGDVMHVCVWRSTQAPLTRSPD
jgi:hypothetical protein